MVEIYDSTLRDGSQAEGIAYSLEDKLLISRRLDELGVHYIEGGWPNPTSPKDLAFFKEVKKLNLSAHVTAFGSTRRAENTPEQDPTLNTLLAAETEYIAIFGKSWNLHVIEVLGTTLGENLQMIEDSVAFLVENHRKVIYDAEHFFDGYKADPAYAIQTLQAAQKGGAHILVLCDTNGGTLTKEMIDIVEALLGQIQIPFGIHTHNDSGVAVANSLMAVELGAIQVQGTFNGYGERCGNANLCSIIPNLELKMGLDAIGPEKVQELMGFSRFLSEIANVAHDRRQPFVGESAFAHKGGAHIDGVTKVEESFEHVKPEVVGNERRFLVSDQSGGAAIVAMLAKIIPGINKKDHRVGKVLDRVKQMENEGYQYEAADGSFELLARRRIGLYADAFTVTEHRYFSKNGNSGECGCDAIVRIVVNGEKRKAVAVGDGPVNALDLALREALEGEYPSIQQVHLDEYKVRTLPDSDGTAAKVRVLIESSDGRETWITVGVSENIVEASWDALLESMHYKIMYEKK